MTPIRTLACAGLLLATVAACTTTSEGGDRPVTEAPPAAVSTPDANLQAKLLSESDLPPGFTETALPNIKGGLGTIYGCPPLEVKASTDATSQASVAFAGAAPGTLVSETLRLTSVDSATRALAELASVPGQCGKFSAETLGMKVDLTAIPASMPALGTETVGIQLTATGVAGIVIDEYVVGIRDDKMVILLVFVTPGQTDRAIVELVAVKAWEKAVSAGVKPAA